MKKTFIIMTFLLFAVLLFTLPLQTASYTNSIGMKFKNITAGNFYDDFIKNNSQGDNAAVAYVSWLYVLPIIFSPFQQFDAFVDNKQVPIL